ncbi:MAG: S-layer homology domain-containing protein [Acidimicrobiia bacterium]|jgi:hypothetical protein
MDRKTRTTAGRRRFRILVVAFAAFAALIPVAAFASHSFNDVPDTSVFHGDISWLADAGVTLGCNPPDNDQFCPSSNVTREQMAAFLRRLAENQVVDAASVQGVVPSVGNTEVKWSGVTDTTATTLDSFTVEVPGPGTLYLQVAGNLHINADATSSDAINAYARIGVCTEMDSLSATDCGPASNLAVFYQDPDDADDIILIGGNNATPGFSRTLLVEAPAAGTMTFYVNGFTSSASYSFNSFGVHATAVLLPGELTVTAASASASPRVPAEQ